MHPGFCPYCGHQNPVSYRFCESCRRPLAAAGSVPWGPPPKGQTTLPVELPAQVEAGTTPSDAPPPGSGEEPPDEVRALPGSAALPVIIAIVVALFVVLAAFFVLSWYFGSHPATTPSGPSGHPQLVDLCVRANASNCAGGQFTLPRANGVATVNHTGCLGFNSLGAGEQVWLNYSVSTTIHGVAVPARLYSGAGSFTEDPPGFLNNSSEHARIAWSSNDQPGSYRVTVQIPNDGQSWCVGWWNPSGTTTLTWNSDVNLTYYR